MNDFSQLLEHIRELEEWQQRVLDDLRAARDANELERSTKDGRLARLMLEAVSEANTRSNDPR